MSGPLADGTRATPYTRPRALGEWPPGVHPASHGVGHAGVMKIPFTTLGALVAYFVWSSTFADATRDVLAAMGR